MNSTCNTVVDNFIKELHNAGYLKLSEDAVVLTKEEAERFRGQTINIAKVEAQARKEMAKEIIKDIEDRLKALCNVCGAVEEFHIKYIKHSMAATYGVEVEE